MYHKNDRKTILYLYVLSLCIEEVEEEDIEEKLSTLADCLLVSQKSKLFTQENALEDSTFVLSPSISLPQLLQITIILSFFILFVYVVFGISDVSDLIFEAYGKFTARNAFSHLLRQEPLERLPKIHKILEEDPVRLKRIIFYYDKPLNTRKAAELAVENRQRGDFIIIEYTSITDRFRFATLMALLSDYENVGNTSIIILPESMLYSSGIIVIFGISDVSDLISEAYIEFTARNAFSHWLRQEPLERIPNIPKILEEDPVRLKCIIFYYDKPLNPRKAAELAVENRQRGDFIIIEYTSITDRFRFATLMALLSDYENVGNTSIIILPESEDLQLSATQYTRNLWKIDAFGSLKKLEYNSGCADAEFTARNAFSHWLRQEPLERHPKIPKILEEDPVRLKPIIFCYDKPLNPRKAAELAVENRQRGDLIIIEYPSITDRFRFATLMALLSDYENVGNTSIIILPESMVNARFKLLLWNESVVELNRPQSIQISNESADFALKNQLIRILTLKLRNELDVRACPKNQIALNHFTEWISNHHGGFVRSLLDMVNVPNPSAAQIEVILDKYIEHANDFLDFYY